MDQRTPFPIVVALCLFVGFLGFAVGSPSGVAQDQAAYSKDVAFALDELEKNCGHFFKLKKIDWKAVRKEMTAAATKVGTPTELWALLNRLIARLRDGHARVEPGPKGGDVTPPVGPGYEGLGLHCCHIGKKVYVKGAWAAAGNAGLKPGMEIVKIGGKPAAKWLAARTAEYRGEWSFSTDQHAAFFTTTWGMLAKNGERLEIQFKTLKRKLKKRKITPDKKTNQRPVGPAFYPENADSHGDLVFGITAKGFGYISVRRCKGDLPDQIDHALASLRVKVKRGDLKGLILDFRSNTGGGFDHADLMGRFIPVGKQMRGQEYKGRVQKRYKSTSDKPYTGPIVTIVDATVVSAGETASGMFKEEGRGYMIGESPTAGMSSQKKTIALPSGLFKLYVSIGSNMGRYNEMRGVEGIGIIPHEVVQYKPKDLAAGKDTLIERADAILKRFPKKKVPYEKRFSN